VRETAAAEEIGEDEQGLAEELVASLTVEERGGPLTRSRTEQRLLDGQVRRDRRRPPRL
jgi:hypothetical protein